MSTLLTVIETYFYNKYIPSILLNKIEKILKDESYRIKYNIKKLSEQDFIMKLIKYFDEKHYNKKFENAKDLYNYFMAQFKNIYINNFEVRNSAE